jgi:hypothetical protein
MTDKPETYFKTIKKGPNCGPLVLLDEWDLNHEPEVLRLLEQDVKTLTASVVETILESDSETHAYLKTKNKNGDDGLFIEICFDLLGNGSISKEFDLRKWLLFDAREAMDDDDVKKHCLNISESLRKCADFVDRVSNGEGERWEA